MDVIRVNRQRTLWVISFIAATFIFLSGCGDDGNSAVDSTDTGGISFDIKWPEVNSLSGSDSPSKSTAGDRCLDGTLSYVIFAVYDKDGNLLVDLDDATFGCEDGKGVVTNVPAQSGIRLVVLGLGYNETTETDDILLRGEHGEDITVDVGKTTQLGSIQTHEFFSGLSRPMRMATLLGFTGVSFEWTGAQSASSYRLTINRTSPAGAAAKVFLTSDLSIPLSSLDENFLVNSGFYSWSVAPVDAYGNYGRESELRRFSFYFPGE